MLRTLGLGDHGKKGNSLGGSLNYVGFMDFGDLIVHSGRDQGQV